jgi:hypothetical protein
MRQSQQPTANRRLDSSAAARRLTSRDHQDHRKAVGPAAGKRPASGVGRSWSVSLVPVGLRRSISSPGTDDRANSKADCHPDTNAECHVSEGYPETAADAGADGHSNGDRSDLRFLARFPFLLSHSSPFLTCRVCADTIPHYSPRTKTVCQPVCGWDDLFHGNVIAKDRVC